MSNILDTIRFEGDNSNIVHKHSIQDFNSKSQLIVGESQEALFYKDGQALDLFGAGRHTLDTNNLPIMKRVFSSIFGGDNPFQCEVFFVNKVSVLDILWGTDLPITLEDPKYNILVNIKSFGQMGIKVLDTRKFIVKVVGQLDNYSVESVRLATKGMVKLVIKETIAKAIVDSGWSVLELPAKLSEISDKIKAILNVHLEQIGLILENFFVTNISANNDDLDKLRQVKEKRMEAMTDIDIESIKTIRMSQARAVARETEGYSYQDERKFDILQAAAANEGVSGSMMGAGMGLGMGFGVGEEVGKVANQAFHQQKSTTCPNCQNPVDANSKFCSSCGQPLTVKKNFCINCGTELPSGALFCPECGTKQQKPKKACPSCGTTVNDNCKFCPSCGKSLS